MAVIIKSDNKYEGNGFFTANDLPFFDTTNLTLWMRGTSVDELTVSGNDRIRRFINKSDKTKVDTWRTSDFNNDQNLNDDMGHAALAEINNLKIIQCDDEAGGVNTGNTGRGYFVHPDDNSNVLPGNNFSVYGVVRYKSVEETSIISVIEGNSYIFRLGSDSNFELRCYARHDAEAALNQVSIDTTIPTGDFITFKATVNWDEGEVTLRWNNNEATQDIPKETLSYSGSIIGFFKSIWLNAEGELDLKGEDGFSGDLAELMVFGDTLDASQDKNIMNRMESLRDELNA